jgi:hypothetical protein
VNNRPPLNESMASGDGRPGVGWANWFSQVFLGIPWKRGFNVTETLNFGAIAAQSQAALAVTLAGVRPGDAVQVTAPDVSGIVFTGAVTANDTVTVYAKNFSAGLVDPGSQVFRLLVLQN